MPRPLPRSLKLEHLEARNCPAPLTFMQDSAGNLTITGTPDNANGGLTLAATSTNTFDITDGVTPVLTNLVVGGKITVNTQADADTVNLDLTGGAFTGSFSLNSSTGADTFNLLGANPLGGNLSLTNVQFFTPAAGSTIGGNFTFNAAAENDFNAVTIQGSTIGGSASYTGGNGIDLFNVPGSTIGGNVTASMGNGLTGTFDGSTATIGGNLIYSGGSGDDSVDLTSSVVGGSATLTLGFATGVGNSLQFTGTVGRNFYVSGGAGVDSINTFTGTVGGTAYFSLGEGANTLVFTGLFGSSTSSFSYYGGSGVDTLTYTPAAGSSRVRFTASLGAGNDVVTFGSPATNPSSAWIDFGAGADTVTGTINFPFTFLNLP